MAGKRVRRTAVGVLVVLSCLGLLLSSVTLWANQTFLNTENWVALVAPLGHDPKVVSAVSAYAANTTSYSDLLTSLGFKGQAVTAQLNEIVTQQGYMMATNDFFRISCAGFVVLACLVWVTKPKKGAAASMGH